MKKISTYLLSSALILVLSLTCFSQKTKMRKRRRIERRVTMTIKPKYLSKKINRGLVTYSPGSNVRRASYTIYKFYSKSFLNYIGHPAKLKKRVKIKIYIKYIRDRRYVPKKGAMPSGGFRNKYVYAEVTGRIDIKDQKSFTPEKKNKTTYKKMNKTLTLVIRLNRVKINSDGYYLYKAGNPYRRRARFKRYLFSKNNYRKFIKSGRKKPVKVQIKIFKVKIHTWYPKNPRANYPIGGFKTFFYYARILKVK